MNLENEQLRDILAAEYVIGTLRGSARRRFEKLLSQDTDLQQRTEYWAESLQPLAERLDPVQPPARIWASIQARLGMDKKSEKGDAAYTGMRWWRGALTSLALTLILAAVLVLGPVRESTQFTADIQVALENKEDKPVWVVDADSSLDTVVVKPVRNIRLPDKRSLELWLVLESGEPPVSLGLMPTERGRKYVVKSSVPLEEGIGFAVSLEPEGGSPTGSATGPILYIQTWRST